MGTERKDSQNISRRREEQKYVPSAHHADASSHVAENDLAVLPGTDPLSEIAKTIDVGAAVLEPDIKIQQGELNKPVLDDEPPATPVTVASSPESTNSVESTLPVVDTEPGIIVVKPEVARVVLLPKLYRLPNFTIGKSSACEWRIPEGIRFDFDNFNSKANNVSVEVKDGVLAFTPSEPGEISVPLTYNNGNVVTFCMTVNPDPWSLWTIASMDETSVVFDSDKKRLASNHKDVISEIHPGLKIIGASRRGRSHERSGTFRDDDMGVWSDEARGNYVFIVSDGAGSCKFSREGAKQAIEFIKAKLDDNKDNLDAAWLSSEDLKPDCKVGMLLAILASKAKEHVVALAAKTDASGTPCKVKDFSGTLLMAALKKEADGSVRLVTFTIGDGAIAWRSGVDDFGLMCRPDSGEFGGGTRFLVTPEVWKTVFFPSKDIPWTWNSFCNSRVHCRMFTPEEAKTLQVFLMSDGVSDPWFETDAGLEHAENWRRFVTETLEGMGDNQAGINLADEPSVNSEKLWEWLYFRIVGNHDDRTIIMVYTDESVKKEVVNG